MVLMGESIDLRDLLGDEDTMSLTDLTGDDRLGAAGGSPRVALIVAGQAGGGEEGGQVVFNGEAAGESAGELVEVRERPTPAGLVWPGTVIGAVDHGG